jgi:predicted small metal-binding protein
MGGIIMGYSLACGDVMPGCAATFNAETEDELLAQVGPHAADAHGITEITPEVLEAVKAAIKHD